MATTINLGNFYDGFCGATYTCYLIYDGPTRSGDNVTITNVKARIVSNQSWGTEGRIGVSLTIGGSSVLSNSTFVSSYTYPTDTTVTLTSSKTVSNLTTSLSYSISFSDTGYGTGWNSNYSFSKSGSITCPARTYTVSYNANNGSGAPSSQTKTYNVTLTLSSTIPTRSGYDFLRWNTASDGSGTNYSAGASYTNNAAVTLYAQWQQSVATYGVSYNGNGATSGSAPSSQTKTQNVALTLATNTGNLAKPGCTLLGWNVEPNGSGTHYDLGASYTANVAVLLYAEWSGSGAQMNDGSAWRTAIPWIWDGNTWRI